MIKAFTIQINGISKAITQQGQLTKAIKATKIAMDDKNLRGAGYAKLQRELAKLNTLQKQLRSNQRVANREREIDLGKAKGSYRAINAELVNLRNRYKEASAAERQLFGKDQLRKMRKLDNQLKKMDASMGNYQRNVGNYSGALGKFGSGAARIGKNLLAGFGVIGGIHLITSAMRAGVDTINDYQDQLKKLSSITGLTGSDLEDLGKRAINLTGQFGTSASKILEGFALVGSAKPELLKDAAALEEVTKQAEILSKAGGLDLTTAVSALTRGLNQFNEGADKAAEFTDILATSQQLGASRVEQLAEGLKVVGSVAKIVGLDFGQLNAAQQALAKGGIEGAEAGTKLRNIFLALIKTGRRELNPAFTDMNDILDTLAAEVTGAEEAVDLFDKRNAAAGLTLIQNRDLYKSIEENVNDVGNAFDQATTNTDTNRTAVQRLSTEWGNFILSIEDGEGSLSNAFGAVTGYFEDRLFLLRKVNDGTLSGSDLFSFTESFGQIAARVRADGTVVSDEVARIVDDILDEGLRLEEFGLVTDGSDAQNKIAEELGNEVSTQDNEITHDEETLRRQAEAIKRLEKEISKERAAEFAKLKKDLQARADAYNDNANDLVEARNKNLISAEDYSARVKEAEVIDTIASLEFLLAQTIFTETERQNFLKKKVEEEIKLRQLRNDQFKALNKEFYADEAQASKDGNDEVLKGLEEDAKFDKLKQDDADSEIGGEIGLFQEQALDRYREGLTTAAEFERELEQARLRERLLYLDALLAAETLNSADRLKLTEERAKLEGSLESQQIKELEDLREAANESLKDLGRDLLNTLFDARTANIEREREEAVRDVELRLETEADFHGASSALRARAAEDAAKKIKVINDKANKEKKKTALLQAIINGALAAGQALANTTLTFPASLLALIPIAAATAAQVATIAGVGFAEGGFTKGQGVRDSTGYEVAQINPDGTYYHSDEYVVPSRVKNTGRGMALISELEGMRHGMGYRERTGMPVGFAEGGFNASGGNPFSAPVGGQAVVIAQVALPDDQIKKQAAVIALGVAEAVAVVMADGFDEQGRNAERKGRLNAQTNI